MNEDCRVAELGEVDWEGLKAGLSPSDLGVGGEYGCDGGICL